MADRFEKFTARARKVLTLAQEEAHRYNHNYIGTEHLLLGLVREGDGVAARVLAGMNVDEYRVRKAVEFIIGRGDSTYPGEITLTPRAKKVIELAVDEARRLNHHFIGTEHLLLGLIREGQGVAAGVLESMGVSLERVRQAVLLVVDQNSQYADAERNTGPEPLPSQRQVNRATYVGPGSGPVPLEHLNTPFGDIWRVVSVNHTHVVDGVAATILSIEIYEHGMIVHGRFRDEGAEEIASYGPLRRRMSIQVMIDIGDTRHTCQWIQSFMHIDSIWFTARHVPAFDVGGLPLKLRLEARLGPETESKQRQWDFEIEV